MIRKDARKAELLQAENDLDRLQTAAYCAAMSDSRYYTNGRKARDDADILAASNRVAELKKEESDD